MDQRFVLLGAGIGLVLTASSDAIIGTAGVDDAGVAGGLQSTAVRLGGVLGTTILGSVLSSRVGSVLVDQLTRTGTPAPVGAKLTAAKEPVAQGVCPMIPGMPASLAHAVTHGSHSAFMVGLHASMVVAAVAAAFGAVLAMLVRRGENSGRSYSPQDNPPSVGGGLFLSRVLTWPPSSAARRRELARTDPDGCRALPRCRG